jgi:hypothetical protein
MGLNATTFVPAYTSGEVLTAADLTVTNSGAPVFADAAARDAAFGGASEKTLAEGQLAYLEDSDIVQYYDGSGWATVGPSADSGLTLVSATTIGTTVASVTVSSAFSSTYDSYLIQVSGGVASTAVNLNLQLGSTTTGYYAAYPRLTYSTGATANVTDNNSANFSRVGTGNTNNLNASITVINPNFAKNTFISATYVDPDPASVAGTASGFVNNTTAYTAFTVLPNTGTLTGGTIRVYGYKN